MTAAGTSRTFEQLGPGTYYWQVRAHTPNGTVEADGETWWSFTVGGSGSFTKMAPANGMVALPATIQAQWTAVPDQGYLVCWDQVDNDACDTAWWPNGGATARILEELPAGTYYWQVKATNGLEANNDWWSFTVGAPMVTFSKVSPGAHGISTNSATNFTWQGAAGAQMYEFCIDTIDNNICDTAWQLNGPTSRIHGGLFDGQYFWQVKVHTASGSSEADNGTWFQVKIDAPDPIREYIYLGDTLLASLTLTTGTPVLTYYHTDALGSVRAITNSAGAPVLRYDFGPFGEGGSLQGDPRQFTGQERDGETALDYFHARYMRQVWGRFTTPDDSAFMNPYEPSSLNPYAYVWNNPLRWIDPTGHDKQLPFIDCGESCQKQMQDAIAYLWSKETWLRWLNGFSSLMERLNDEVSGRKFGEELAANLKKLGSSDLFTVIEGMEGIQLASIAWLPGGRIAKGSRSLVVHIPKQKLSNFLKRGWTPGAANQLINNPVATSAATNRTTGNAATAFFRNDGHYIVRDDVTGTFVQGSNTHDRIGRVAGPGTWVPDSSIVTPFFPVIR